MIIRAADIGDAHAIATIHVRSWQHAYTEILPEDELENLSIEKRTEMWEERLQPASTPTRTLVVEVDNKIVGFARWGPNTDQGADPRSRMLYSLYVLPDYMGKGIGSELLLSVEADMIASGADFASLHVLRDNKPTRAFYKRQGWRLVPESEQTEHFFGMDVITVRYEKAFI